MYILRFTFLLYRAIKQLSRILFFIGQERLPFFNLPHATQYNWKTTTVYVIILHPVQNFKDFSRLPCRNRTCTSAAAELCNIHFAKGSFFIYSLQCCFVITFIFFRAYKMTPFINASNYCCSRSHKWIKNN